MNKRWMVGIIAGLVLIGAGGLLSVLLLHRNDYCISQGRHVTDKEMYRIVLRRTSQPYLFESLRSIELEDGKGKLASLHRSDQLIRKTSSRPLHDSVDISRVDQAMKNPDFLSRCCSRTRIFEGGDWPPPTLLDVFFGQSPRAVYVNRAVVVVKFSSLYPTPRFKYITTSGVTTFETESEKLKIVGPIREARKRQSRVNVGVCGDVLVHDNLIKDKGYSM